MTIPPGYDAGETGTVRAAGHTGTPQTGWSARRGFEVTQKRAHADTTPRRKRADRDEGSALTAERGYVHWCRVLHRGAVSPG